MIIRTLALTASLVQFASAADWPEFRGPTADGATNDAGLPLEWDAENNVAWKVEVPGLGWSSPVVVGDSVYLTTAVEEGTGLSLRVLSLDKLDGKLKWETEVLEATADQVSRIHRKNSQASPTPIVRDGAVYAHFGYLGTAKLSADDGAIAWTNNELSFPPVHGNGGCPELVGDALIFTADGAEAPFVAALDADDGTLKWKHERDVEAKKTFSFCTPLAIEAAGRSQVIVPGSNVVSSLDPQTGEEIWRVRYEGYSVVPRPAFAHGLIYISTGFDSPSILAIRPDGSGDVTESHIAWKVSKRAPNTPSFLVIGDEIYMASDSGIVSSIDAKTGDIHYQERATGPISASPISAPGRMYFTGERGETVVLKPGKRFEILAENDLGEKVLASMAAADGTLYLRTEKHLYALRER